MKIVIGGDHVGFHLKQTLTAMLQKSSHTVDDVGCFSPDPVDFPDIAMTLCEKVRSGQVERGVMVCGTGVGAAIAANKVPGIRASICHDIHSAHQSVEHDDVNVMCIGAQIVGPWLAEDLVQAYLAATFSTDEDCRRRVAKLHEMEWMYMKPAVK